EEDQFYYDRLKLPNGEQFPMRVCSLVGLITLFAVDTLDSETIDALPGFRKRMEWFTENRPDLAANLASMTREGVADRRLLSLVGRDRLRALLKRLLDPNEFLSDYGVRGLSKFHEQNPYVLHANGSDHRVGYEPGESQSGLFGGNSNWRGPIWFPVNYLLIESLQKFHHYHGDAIEVECPTGSGNMVTLDKVCEELSRRLSSIFLPCEQGFRPGMAHHPKFSDDPHFKNNILFYEYFN
ncbi:MAG: glucosidase, partial [Acidobacteria bacterium]|nr:glucosidase [Acidobacteriota bacterium]